MPDPDSHFSQRSRAEEVQVEQEEEEEREFGGEDDGVGEGDADDLEGEAFVGEVVESGVLDVFAAGGFAFSGTDYAGLGLEQRMYLFELSAV
ncbi:MAG: hypothetical protein Q9207_003380 [Kuettlingeria erythrocarpa]